MTDSIIDAPTASLVREYLTKKKWNYWLDISHILEIGTFVTALIAVRVDSERFELSFTVLAILLALLTLLSYQQSMFIAGIYVTMLFEVLRTLILASRAGKKFKQVEEDIGLAVGDIESIQKNAELRLLAVQIEDVFRVERRLPKFILRRLHKTSITKYPNKHSSYGWRRGLVAVQKIISGLKDNASLDEASDDIFEQTADSFFHRLNTLEQKVDKLSANIASQTEMLEKVINMLPAVKEAESYDVAHDSLEAKL